MANSEAVKWAQCVLCQNEIEEILVLNPRLESYKRLLDSVKARAAINDGNYKDIENRLKDFNEQHLEQNNAKYHRKCYSDVTNKSQLRRAQERYDFAMATGSQLIKTRGIKRKLLIDEDDPEQPSTSSVPFTRSNLAPTVKEMCFFCQDATKESLIRVSTDNAGKALVDAVEKSSNPELKVRLSACIAQGDAHAIDVFYHKSCWTNQVFHETREKAQPKDHTEPLEQRACVLDLVNIIKVETERKKYLTMEDIETTYIDMLGEDGIANHLPPFSRKWLKSKILSSLPHLKSCRQANRRKSSLLYSPEACEGTMVNAAYDSQTQEEDTMQLIYNATAVIRKSISDFIQKNQQKEEMKVCSSKEDVPTELYSMIRWILVGTATNLGTQKRSSVAERAALTISQNIMYGFRSNRQVDLAVNKDSVPFRSTASRENPQVLGLSLSLHHGTRNRKLIDLLNSHHYCLSYRRTLKIETALANAVIKNAQLFQGLYVPPFLKKGKFVFFAADNTDFQEETPDGKGTTHGTIIAVYQKTNISGDSIAPPLKIDETKTLSVDPFHVDVIHCSHPKPQHVQREEPFKTTDAISESQQLTHLKWLLPNVFSRMREETETKIPGWAGYNSLLSEVKPTTQVGALPLLPEVAHEWSTLMTVITQTTALRKLVVGEDHPTVISLDMALYEKVIQLLDANLELKKSVVPRLGELHVVMAALRALGTSIENSGIDDAWIEANVFGTSTTRQILKCSHYKRSLRAHIYSYVALYEMAWEEFFKDNPPFKEPCLKAAEAVERAVLKETKSEETGLVLSESSLFLENMAHVEVLTAFKEWKKQRSENAMFKAMINYMERVESILTFIAATRNSDLELHLQAGEQLSKLFFAFDRIKYKRLWPRYIADMHDLKQKHPETWKELKAGNISVTKTDVPFVSIGADHACEHLNKMMKAQHGLIGISNNVNARQRFFLVTPELAQITKEYESQFDLPKEKRKAHHDLGASQVRREHEAITKIKTAILKHGNPFAVQGEKLHNIITHAYIPDEYVPVILNADAVGQQLYEKYISERINGNISLWAPVKKENNKMYVCGNKETKIKIRDQTIDLKETKDLYGRLMILAKSNRDINQKEAIGNFEFTLTPGALFSPDGSILQTADKAKLIHAINNLISINPRSQENTSNSRKKIALIDGMVLLQKMSKKPATIMTVKDLAVSFNEKLCSLTRGYDEVVLVFDTYIQNSLKSATRERRRQGKAPVQYQIRDDTCIKHIPMNKFLSHEKTKSDLTDYLAEKVLELNASSPTIMITSSSGHTKSNNNFAFHDNNHEEADTLLIHHAVLAGHRNPPDAKVVIFSPDTDVLILAIANYDSLPSDTSLSMTSGLIEIGDAWRALGPDKARSLLGFHAFTGSDTTGRFNGIGKTSWFKHYLEADTSVIGAFLLLSSENDISDSVFDALETFVCKAYSPKGLELKSIPELRWHLFCKYMAENSKLPPTIGALRQHILRAHLQARVWGQSIVAIQDQTLKPIENGFFVEPTGQLKPLTTKCLPAPKAIIELVSCRCKKNCTSMRCSCRSNNLSCTDLCLCSDDCNNTEDMTDANSDDEEDLIE